MFPFSVAVSTQIRYLLEGLNERNSDSVFKELCEYIGYGTEGGILVLQTCFNQLNIYGKDLKNMTLGPIFASIIRYILQKPNFSTVLCESIRSVAVNEDLLENLCNALQLSAPEKIGIGLALSDSENPDIRMCGKRLFMVQIDELFANHKSVDSILQIQNILLFLNQSEGLGKHLDSFKQMLSLIHLKENVEFVLAPLFSDDMRDVKFSRNLDVFGESSENDFESIIAEMKEETSVAGIMKELGYGCTTNVSQCKEMLSLFLPLTEITVARIVGTVVRTNNGLEDSQTAYLTFCAATGISSFCDQQFFGSWNIDVLIDSIKQLVPGINWINVFENLDHEGFYIPSEEAFSLLMSVFRHASQDPFPLHAVCGFPWKNVKGQLSFLKYAVLAPPEVFSFAHSGRQLAYFDAVSGHKFQPGYVNHAWLCLDLLEVLCRLAEKGHASSVRQMLEYPLKHCPEALLLGMANINTAYNLLQYEVSTVVFPMILQNASGSSLILHLWHVNPNILLQGFIESIYTKPENIIKVLDLSNELKILSPVLEMIPCWYSIRMAALATQKGLIDLEKWLNTNLTTYKDTLFEGCLKFVKEVQLSTQTMPANCSHQSDSLWNLYSETVPTFLKILQAHASLISSGTLSKDVEKLNLTFTPINMSIVRDGGTNSSASNGHADDIEAEANSYFHQIFSGQLAVESLIQILTRLKGSSELREQSIFDCVIANIFEEYKFFIKYPEMQLRIAAVLFGSLIKHQLITHLTLGIALRAVLDALRKPADSKMFIFGSKALEQFMVRLVEWPQYCNHILQISHLRVTHPDIVTNVELALSRILSSNPELDLGHSIVANEHNGSIPAAQMEILRSSLLSVGSCSELSGSQVCSPIQLQQRRHKIEEQHNASAPSSSCMMPGLSSADQVSAVAAIDTSSTPKSQSIANASSALSSTSGFVRASHSATTARFGSALNIETLVAAAEKRENPIQAPASEIQDKSLFIVNNLSLTNLEAKAKEFSELSKEQFYPWFAQYMVMKRASIEVNFHDLYIKFLDQVNSKHLNKEILLATYENCKVLLRSELIKSSSEERSLLKNLGSWLGKITIGKNQVLRAREIDPKSLIIEAYEKGLMIAVIPFTSKLLESCQNSLAYQPPNPWTMGILRLLAEIHVMPNVKMNLKFEIEVLFKHLSVEVKDVVPTSLLKDRAREVEGNPDFSNNSVVSSQPQMVGEVNSGVSSMLSKVELPIDVVSSSHPSGQSRIIHQIATPRHLTSSISEEEKLTTLGVSDHLPPALGILQGQSQLSVNQLPGCALPTSNIEQQVVVNPKLHGLGLHLHFQSVLPVAMERAIKDIVSSTVQRSVSIAIQTTKELVLKDYAMESDETRIYNAAHLMVASLAGSLAHVTCKELLRISLISQLRKLLQRLNLPSEQLEPAVQLVTSDNVDLGCALIEQAATDKAIQIIDGEISQQLSVRRKQREGLGHTFFDAGMYAQGHMGVLPDALLPKPGSLSHSQQRVYEDFIRLPWQSQCGLNTDTVSAGPSASINGSLPRGYVSASGQLNSGIHPSGFGNTGAGANLLDLAPEELDSGLVKQFSVSLTHVAMADDTAQHNIENAVVATLTSASASESLPPESLDAVKASKNQNESGASARSFLSISANPRLGSNISEPSLTTGDALDKYKIVSEKLETLLTNDNMEAEIQAMISEVPGIILGCISRDEAALAVAQKVFKGLYENTSNNAHVGAHLAILSAIRDVSKLVVKELTSWVIYSEEDRKFNIDITVGLIRSELLNLAEYNVHMAKLLDAGRNKTAAKFAVSLIQALMHSNSKVISELHHLVDALAKLAARPGSPESLHHLIKIAKNPAALSSLTAGKEESTRQARDRKASTRSAASSEEYNVLDSLEPDPVGFPEQVSMLFYEWYQIYDFPGENDATCGRFVLQLLQRGLLKGDEMLDRFLRLLMELSISHCLSSEVLNSGRPRSQQQKQLSFLAIDSYAALVYSILKFYPEDQGSNKLHLLSKVLAVTVRFIQKDVEDKKTFFNPRPYFRLFINWLQDLSTLEPSTDGANFQVLTALANAFHALQPLKVPAFSFSWLELVSHRSFMPKLLTGNSQKGWPFFHRLLVDLFQFLEPYLRNAELGEPVHFLYKGSLRVLLVLLHDFPEFLCDYHFSFCDVIPPSCIQMRNIILSAFPRNMRLPDPSTPNLKIELLAEINQSPQILSEVDDALKAKQIKGDLDEYLKTRQQGSMFLSELKQKLLLSPTDAARAGIRYNVPLINSIVLYVGMQAKPPAHSQPIVPLDAALDIFQTLIVDLDTEGRYLFLNAIANQLRYPNSHTHYFSYILLYLFVESNQEIIKEQITRVLLERLIVNRPHPWGLLVAFIEIIKNPMYNFWSWSFTRCAPEIEKLFESVSRSCGGSKPVEGVISGGMSDVH